MNERVEQIQARLAEIDAALDNASAEELTALETESRGLLEELDGIRNTAQSRQQIRDSIAAGAGTVQERSPAQQTAEARAAAQFASTNRMTIGTEQARAALVSSGTLATPTQVTGINDTVGAQVSSIIDLCNVVNCVGMGTYRVAYVKTDAAAAGEQTEGEAVTAGGGEYGYVDIKPTTVAIIDYISEQAKNQTPLQYSAKVRQQALIALRKKAAAIATAALTKSELVKVATGSGAEVSEKTLRNIALSYGSPDSVVGGAHLILSLTELIAFGDIRGTSDKKPVYEIIPDTANPNTGVIKDGGLSVHYVLNSNLPAGTMFYGNLKCLELGLFSDYKVRVSEDFAINKLMDTIVGNVDIGSNVTVKNGFVKYVTTAAAAG